MPIVLSAPIKGEMTLRPAFYWPLGRSCGIYKMLGNPRQSHRGTRESPTMSYKVQAAAAVVVAFASFAHADPFGSVIAFGDEWVLSESAFAADNAATTQFANNVADYFSPNGPGNFLVLSNNPVAYGASAATAFTNAGHSWTVNPGAFVLNAANLAAYDGVFFSGSVGSGLANAAQISQYVANGGSVFVSAGTGEFGSAAAEANAWNPLLSVFGLGFGSTFYGLPTSSALIDLPLVSGTTALRQDLSNLLWGYGQEVFDLDANDPMNRIELTGDFLGINEPPPNRFMNIAGSFNIPVPAPSSAVALGVMGLLTARRRR